MAVTIAEMNLKISETALISAEQSRQVREQQVNSLALRLRAVTSHQPLATTLYFLAEALPGDADDFIPIFIIAVRQRQGLGVKGIGCFPVNT